MAVCKNLLSAPVSMRKHSHLGLVPVAEGEDVDISSEPVWQGGNAAGAEVPNRRVKG